MMDRLTLLPLRMALFLAACAFMTPEVFPAEPTLPSEGLLFHRWKHENGLPDDTVTALLQAQDGYLWVGTARGLARFDGVQFDAVQLADEKSKQVVAVTSLCEDEAHRLWIGTRESGLYWVANNTVHRFAEEGGNGNESVTSLAADSGGQLWVGTAAGLFRVNLATLRWTTSLLGFTNEIISSVHAARSGTIWITTRKGMSQYKNGRITAVDFQAENEGRNPEFMGLYEDRGGNLWAFGDTYLVNLSEGKRFNYFRTGDASSFRIWTLCEGRGGELWIGTSGQGLFAFSDGKFRPLALRENRLPSDVRAICEDRQGDLWLGTAGGGLIRLRLRREQVFDASSGLPNDTATCIAVHDDGRLWAGFQSGLFAATGRRFEPIDRLRLISSLCVAPDGSAWAGTRGLGLFSLHGTQEIHYGSDTGLSSDFIPALAVEPDGTVLIGTSAGSVHALKQGRLDTFGRKNGLSGAPISALCAGKSGNIWVGTSTGEIFHKMENDFHAEPAAAVAGAEICALNEDTEARLWIGTAGRGLACLKNNQVANWDESTGFPDNDVMGVLADTNGVVWVATGKGIFRVENCWTGSAASKRPVARLILEGESTGHESRGFPMALESGNGRLWFVMPGRVVALDPRKVELNSPPAPVYIKKVLANDVSLPLSTGAPSLRLPARLASLEIQFTAPNLAEPEKVRFQHKLDGFDNGWVEGGEERHVRYGRLPYGNYTFHVRAGEANGGWNESQTQLEFIYPAPAWRAPASLVLYALAATGCVVLVVRAASHRRLRLKLERLGRQQAMEKERMRIAQDMHDEVGSKLTKIAYLSDIMAMRGDGPELANLQSIASTSRDLLQSLDEIVWAVNPRNDSLERLAAYLSQYATEYWQNTTVELEMNLPGGLPDHPLSAETRHSLFLAFEEALANALKHSGATKVTVAMNVCNPRFTIRIHDNGRGFRMETKAPGNGQGNGLMNMRQRLADIGGACQIESAPGQGTTVCLSLELSDAKLKYA
jgi:ligand-binding sensor domain-containing protein/signal transduction histidine kinase